MDSPKQVRILSNDDHGNVVFGIDEPYIARDSDGHAYENYMTTIYIMPKNYKLSL